MRTFLLLALIFVLGVDQADARRRHHRSHGLERPSTESIEAAPNDLRERRQRPSRAPPTIAALVPNDWQPAPEDPNWNGKRFVSPDGFSWLAIYRASAEDESIPDHMRSIIFAKDETITYLRGERTWVAVSGFKASRIFYRKAMIACAGKTWHHVAFEYPAELKSKMDALVAAAAQALENTLSNCEQSVSATRPY